MPNMIPSHYKILSFIGEKVQSCGRKVGHFINLFVSTTGIYDRWFLLESSRIQISSTAVDNRQFSLFRTFSFESSLIFVYSFPHRVFSRSSNWKNILYRHETNWNRPLNHRFPRFFQDFRISKFLNCSTTILNFSKLFRKFKYYRQIFEIFLESILSLASLYIRTFQILEISRIPKKFRSSPILTFKRISKSQKIVVNLRTNRSSWIKSKNIRIPTSPTLVTL